MNGVIDELIVNIEDAQLHESGLITKNTPQHPKLDMAVLEFEIVAHILICHYGLKNTKHV